MAERQKLYGAILKTGDISGAYIFSSLLILTFPLNFGKYQFISRFIQEKKLALKTIKMEDEQECEKMEVNNKLLSIYRFTFANIHKHTLHFV